jgi:hypothetical protein
MSLVDVDGLLCQALREVHAGDLEPAIGNAMATLARAITATRELGVIDRLTALENRADTAAIRRLS